MTHQEYWAKREEEALKHYITEEAEYDREINRIYSDMLDSCNEQINAFYGKYAAKEGISLSEAKKRVKSLDMDLYERKAKRYVKEKDLSAQANEEMRLYNATMSINRLEMLKANIGLELISGHNELEKFMSGILKDRTEAELKRQAGILGKTITNNAKTVHSIVNASYKNATFSDRVWMYHDIMKNDLGNMLKTGLIQGKNPKTLARELEKYVLGDAKGGAKFNAERLMRSELARVQTDAQKQSFERNGFDEYTFLANSGCCKDCQAHNGKHYKVKDMMPGENAAPLHPFCRCSTAAYSDRKEYDEWLDFLEKGGTTEEYNKLKAKSLNKNKTWTPKFSEYNTNELRNALLSSGKYSFDEILEMNENDLKSSMLSVWKDGASKANNLRETYTVPKKLKPKELTQWLREIPIDKIPETLNKNSLFQRYSLLKLHNDLPDIVDDLETKDGIALFRSVKNAPTIKGTTICEMTKYDPDAFVGDGIYGDGLYLTTVKAGTERYGDGGHIAAKIKPNAKIIDYDDIEAAMQADGTYGADISVWAIEQGYDAIKVRVDRQEQGEYYYTVLRRSALWIQK